MQRKAVEMAMAVPQVVAHRVTRMAIAGPTLSARDRKEFTGMVEEKQLAIGQAWVAMAAETLRVNQALALRLARTFWSPPAWGKPAGRALANLSSTAALGILDKGLAPFHKKAVANAKRLSGTRLR